MVFCYSHLLFFLKTHRTGVFTTYEVDLQAKRKMQKTKSLSSILFCRVRDLPEGLHRFEAQSPKAVSLTLHKEIRKKKGVVSI